MNASDVTYLPSVPSTNTWLRENAERFGNGHLVVTSDQTAGRGQRGNFWEAEPGKNLTFSMLLRDNGLKAARQFAISEGVALGVLEVLRKELAGYVAPEKIKVKWPNDIYVADDKIAGILIEHTLSGNNLSRSVVGIGVNVNQTIFTSSAPNPVSMAQLSGHCDFNLDSIMERIAKAIMHRMELICVSDKEQTRQHREFLENMWRNDGEAHRFQLPDTSCFAARIHTVESDGMLALKLPDGDIHHFAFKEVAFI
jgi:biotin--[acetyl-coA-carboxylase] ligase